MIAAFVLDAGRMQYGIDRLALDLSEFPQSADERSDRQGKQADFDGAGRAGADRRYAAEDADIALRLAELLKPQLAEIPAVQKLCR